MFTGADDASKIGTINTWNGQNQTNYKSECGKIQIGWEKTASGDSDFATFAFVVGLIFVDCTNF